MLLKNLRNKLKKGLISFLLPLIMPVSFLQAQSSAQGEKLFNQGHFESALKIYEQLIRKTPNSVLYNYRAGRCCYEMKEYASAINYFLNSGERYPFTPYYLGLSYFETFQFERSVRILHEYMQGIDSTEQTWRFLKSTLHKAEVAGKLIRRVEKIAIVDSMVCPKNDFLQFYNYSASAGTLNQKYIKDGRNSWDQISYHTQRNDRHLYSQKINGQLDIMSSFQLLNQWSDPVSISREVNSKYNENYPFLMADGITLYFASDGPESLGGFDIFITKYSNHTKDFLKPENVGFPFNSFANDYMLAMDESSHLGWFATDRNQKQGKVMIYLFEIPETHEYYTAEDSLNIGRYALLKKYPLSHRYVQKAVIKEPVVSDTMKNSDLSFHVNDTLIYTDKNQFRSMEALGVYEEFKILSDELEQKNIKLESLRSSYSGEEDHQLKRSLAREILDLERNIPRMVVKKEELLVKCRNEEIKFLEIQ